MKKSSNVETAQHTFGIRWTVPGGKSGQKWFSTEGDRDAFIEKLVEKEGDDVVIIWSR
jgi:hypothetical protein